MAQQLIVPVYLNQRIVFDLLAMLEGGISHVTRVASVEQTHETTERRFGAEFGLSKALASLLSIGVKAGQRKENAAEDSLRRDEERIHTPASLFYRLRNQLTEDAVLHIIGPDYTPGVSDLVEFSASLIRNPLVQTMDSFLSLMEMAMAFGEGASGAKSTQKQAKRDNGKTVHQMQVFRRKLTEGDSIDVVARGIAQNYQAVITLEAEYLNDPSMADLVDGTFNIVGKITKIVQEGEGGISLLRKSALTVMPRNILDGMRDSLASLSDSEGFNLPDLDLEVPGPAFQVIPIAIFA